MSWLSLMISHCISRTLLSFSFPELLAEIIPHRRIFPQWLIHWDFPQFGILSLWPKAIFLMNLVEMSLSPNLLPCSGQRVVWSVPKYILQQLGSIRRCCHIFTSQISVVSLKIRKSLYYWFLNVHSNDITTWSSRRCQEYFGWI